MSKAKIERYEYRLEGRNDISAVNIYLLRTTYKSVGGVWYFGFEDIGEGVSVSSAILDLAQYVVERNDLDPASAFFYKWYTRYKNRGVEWVQFDWDGKVPQTPTIKKYCTYKENPFH